jgi:feruloyl esterase
MGAQLRGGYAVVATDTGHSGDSPEFAIGHPESIVDWGHRAVHLTAVTARKIVQAFYGSLPRYAYFQGCSTGGHQAFMEAQRYPEDFDGIIAGAPGHNRTHLNAGFLWQFVQNHTADGQARQIIPTNKLQWVVKAAFASCRAQNGASAGGLASDEYLNDPLSCDFDPAALTCQAGDAEDCLTVEQVTALKRMYAGARNPRSGERIYFGWPPGSESSADGRMGWNIYWADPANPSAPARAGFWQHWALDDPQWDWRRFDFDRDMRRTDERLASTINAMNPSLEKFRRRGGKLIHYHGTADPVVPFADSISYWQRVIGKQRGMRDKQQRVAPADSAADAASEFYRLFVAPGLGHCQGGPGPAPVELQHALEDWVERGQAPDRMLARRESGGVNNEAFSRPLCPYPQIARYDDKGPPNTAESFICVTRTRAPQVAQPAADYLR